MKKKVFLFLSLLLWLGVFNACSSDDDDKIDSTLPRVLHEVGEAKDLTGVMHYDQSNQIWYISVDDNNSLDISIQRLDIWGRVDSAFQKEDLPVLFSGDILQWNDNAAGDPLNLGHLVISISHIQKLQRIQ